MIRRISCLILCLFFMITMTACWDAKEVDDWAYVNLLGVDKGAADKYRFTIQVPTFKGKNSSNGGNGNTPDGKDDYETISVDCPSVNATEALINTSLSRTLNYMHAKYCVVSEEVAREGIEPIINGIRRTRQIRRIMHFIVVKGEASKFIEEFNPILGTALSKTQENMMSKEKETGLFDDKSIGEVIDNFKSTKSQLSCTLAAINDFSHLAQNGTATGKVKPVGEYFAGQVPRKGGNKIEYLGSAVFDGDKMVDELNGIESCMVLMAKGEFERTVIALPDPLDPGAAVTLGVSRKKKPEVKVSFQEGKPVIILKIFLEAEIQNLQSNINYEDGKLKPVLEKHFKKYLKEKLDKTLAKCRGLNCDIFGFGDVASMQFLTIPEWEAYNWNSRFRDAKIYTNVDLSIKYTGLVFRTNSKKSSEEKGNK